MTRLAIVSALSAAAISLGACSQSTPYAPQSASATAQDFGYSSTRLGEGLYRVSFAGNQFTSRQTVEDYLLYRAAELTRQRGYTGFSLVRENVDRNVATDVDTYPATGIGTYSTFTPTYGFYGIGGAYSTYDPFIGGPFPGTTVDIDRIERYEAMATVRMYRGTPPVGAQPNFDASEVIARLRDNVQMPG